MISTKVAAILSAGFLLAILSPSTLGFVSDPILYLDASDNSAHPNGWINSGTAGGQIPRRGKTPNLEPNAGPDGDPAYAADEVGQSFGTEGGLSLFFEDWTIEIWMKREGPAIGGGEHQFFGMADGPWPFKQAIILRFDNLNGGPDSGKVRLLLISADGGGVDKGKHFFPGVDIGAKRWHHVAFTFNNSTRTLRSYLDGRRTDSEKTEQDYNAKTRMQRIAIFRSDVGDRDDRVLNGAISLVRLYDKVLNDDEIRENFNHPRAVDPGGKLTTTWGRLKA